MTRIRRPRRRSRFRKNPQLEGYTVEITVAASYFVNAKDENQAIEIAENDMHEALARSDFEVDVVEVTDVI